MTTRKSRSSQKTTGNGSSSQSFPLVAHDLEWDPLNMEKGEEILVKTFTLDEALAATHCDYRCDPQAALTLWLYAGKRHSSVE